MTPNLQRYMKQRSLTDPSQAGNGGAVPNNAQQVPMGPPAQDGDPSLADPYTEGQSAQPLVNPDDGLNEFDPRRRPRPYIDNGQDMWGQMPIPANSQY